MHPFGGAFEVAGDDVEAAADADGEGDLEGGLVGVDPLFLAGGAEGYEDDVGAGLLDLG